MTVIRRSWVVALAGVLLVVGLLGWWMAHDLTSATAAQNKALTDSTATAKVQAEISRALVQVLSYDYTNPAPTEAAAESALSGAAREEYDTLFKSLQERAPGQKLILTAQVQAVGVKELNDDSAKVLVFLDQSSQRADDKEASVSAAQIAVSAKKLKGSWRITKLDPL